MINRRLILLSPDAPAGVVAPPAAPSPTPTPPKPAPAPPKPAPKAPEPPGGEPNEFAEYDAAFSGKKPDAPPPKPDGKLAPKPGEKPTPAPEGDWDDARVEKASPKELREFAKKQKSEAVAAREEVKKATARVTEMEQRIAQAEGKGKDVTNLSEQLATLQKDLAASREELRIAKNEVTPEFKAKYDEPFHAAAQEGKVEVDQLIIITDDGASRKASWENDFAPIYALDYGPATAAAKAKFGDEAHVVMEHYRTLHRLDRQRSQALDAERKSWPEKEKARQAAETQKGEAAKAMFSKAAEFVGQKPEFAPVADDAEGNALLDQGKKEFEVGLNDANFKTPAQKAVWQAHMSHRAIAFPRLQAQLAKRDTEIAELKATIEELKGSKPGKTERPGGGKPTPAAPESRWDMTPAEAEAMNKG